jgi:hypothetical protein
VIFVGIDDTDTLDTPGTNQLARRIAGRLPRGYRCRRALRHQLFFDPRVPYTSHNGSASLLVDGDAGGVDVVIDCLRREMRAWFVPGSDPGLCVALDVPEEVRRFGRSCQHEVVAQGAARALADRHGLHLEGLGGSNDGVIGALAAVGLLAEGQDGRVIHLEGWQWPDDFTGVQPVHAIRERGVEEVRMAESGATVTDGLVDVGRHLRPNIRDGRVVLFVDPAADGAGWRARKLS